MAFKKGKSGKSTKSTGKKSQKKMDDQTGGRPTRYREEYCDQAYRLCLLGYTDKELADFFGVKEQTINNWKHAHKEFFESLKAGKAEADSHVIDSLYKRATGYEHDEVHFTAHDGKVIQTPYKKHYSPNPTSMIFWLKNRQPEKWRDKQEYKHSGTVGREHDVSPEVQKVLDEIQDPTRS